MDTRWVATWVTIKTQSSGDKTFQSGVTERWYAEGVGVVRERRVDSFLSAYDWKLQSYDLAD